MNNKNVVARKLTSISLCSIFVSPPVKSFVEIFRRKMKELNTFQLVKVPEGVEASVKARTVTVKGPRGSLTKAFKHLSVDIYKV